MSAINKGKGWKIYNRHQRYFVLKPYGVKYLNWVNTDPFEDK
jgi:hypothetical protein